ncbi:hypothetical protein [Comamonas sp. lk]|uniref:SCO family protein n=1 Tax=Comamonas sp. lk TaxID=2201272 RepID=UPI000EB21F28|nr:hypothetical protein [Comamonas sp. lk]
MTVHSLPSPEQSSARSGGRWKMLAVLAVCAAPVVASYFTYYVLRPTQQRSFGELIAEQPVLPEAQAQTLDGRSVPLSQLKGQWLLVSTASGDCGERCESHLYLQRQLRETLGKEKDRLDWVWLIKDEQPVPDRIEPGLAQATVLRLPQASIAQWLKPAAGHALEDHLYVVDPQGHWMMRFPADLDQANAGKAKRDLERLLRASSSWDEAGRPEVKP